MPSGRVERVDPYLVAYCDDLRERIGMPDEIMFAIFTDMADALDRARRWTEENRRHLGVEGLVA